MLYHPERLDACDPDLLTLFQDVGSQRDIIVVQGARSVADEQADIDAGRSALHDPLDSLHVTDPAVRPVALAADVAPYPINWQNLVAFQELGGFVKARATALGIGLVWGGDWSTFKDWDHYQLVHPHGETAP
jgi:peptidoglycan LD-endopeptidase CwlK